MLAAIVFLAVAGVVLGGIGSAWALPMVPISREHVQAGESSSRINPIPLKSEGEAGPWLVTVKQVMTGDKANEKVLGESAANTAPPDGFTWVAIRIEMKNVSEMTFEIEAEDFGITDTTGILRRFPVVVAPDPALDGVVKGGSQMSGWVALLSPSDATDRMLVYDSVSIPGTWADRVFSLDADAESVPDVAQPAAEVNKTSYNRKEPAGIGTEIVTRNWTITLLATEEGDAVFDLYTSDDYRTTALTRAESNDEDPWIAMKFRVTNNRTGGEAAFLSPSAFMLTTAKGTILPDVLTLTPPSPDLSTTYYPGATREGWVAFELPASGDADLVVFKPWSVEKDIRFFTWDESEATAPEPTEASGDTEVTPTSDEAFAVDSTVITTEANVRMRSAPTTDGDIVTVLEAGMSLTVTGEPVAGGDYLWYPVLEPESGLAGFVADDFLKAG